MSQNGLVFAHYHSNGILRDDSLELLREAKNYFSHIVFVSTKINPVEANKLKNIATVIQRDNIGYDFFSYREGLIALNEELKNIKYYHLANSSFICTDAKFFWEKIFQQKKNESTLYGITRSFEIEDHIQSYFLIFSEKIYRNPEIYYWWKNMIPISERSKVIKNYEIGYSEKVISENFLIESMFQHRNENFLPDGSELKKDTNHIRENTHTNLNPTNYLWMEIEKNFKILKIELIKKNPYRMDLTPLLQAACISEKFKSYLIQALEN